MEGAPFNGMFVSNRAKALTVELFYHRPCPSTTSRKEPLLIGWSPPPTGFVKLNSDGSAFGNPGSTGAGGVLRDCSGKWIIGFACHIGFTTSFVAKLWGLRDGLMLARRLDVSKIVIEIDVKSIVDLLNCEGDHGFQFHPCSVIFSDCKSLIQLFEVALI